MNLSEWPLSAGFVLWNKGAITGGKGKAKGKLPNSKAFQALQLDVPEVIRSAGTRLSLHIRSLFSSSMCEDEEHQK